MAKKESRMVRKVSSVPTENNSDFFQSPTCSRPDIKKDFQTQSCEGYFAKGTTCRTKGGVMVDSESESEHGTDKELFCKRKEWRGLDSEDSETTVGSWETKLANEEGFTDVAESSRRTSSPIAPYCMKSYERTSKLDFLK
eukprot:Filipodium_phascolosomae@DN5412_c0_g1_i1.p1